MWVGVCGNAALHDLEVSNCLKCLYCVVDLQSPDSSWFKPICIRFRLALCVIGVGFVRYWFWAFGLLRDWCAISARLVGAFAIGRLDCDLWSSCDWDQIVIVIGLRSTRLRDWKSYSFPNSKLSHLVSWLLSHLVILVCCSCFCQFGFLVFMQVCCVVIGACSAYSFISTLDLGF